MHGMGTEITHLDYVSRGGCTLLLSLSNYSPPSNSENTWPAIQFALEEVKIEGINSKPLSLSSPPSSLLSNPTFIHVKFTTDISCISSLIYFYFNL